MSESSLTYQTFAASADNRLSVVMRFHKRERLRLLEEAIFSLALQDWHDLEIVIAVQNGCHEINDAISEIINDQCWDAPPRIQILSVEVPPGLDGRSMLLNQGMARATSRYVAFLDDDDVVYRPIYTTLISRLRQTTAAVAVGGSRVAKMRLTPTYWYVVTKAAPHAWGRTRRDLFRDNFVPIHSYVIDRTRVKRDDMLFDESITLLEDYDFLLRLCTSYQFDFAAIDTPVCECRSWLDGSNSFPVDANGTPRATPAVRHAQKEIEKRKKALLAALPASERASLETNVRDPWANQDHFVFKAARHIYVALGQYPNLERALYLLTDWTWRCYKRVRGPR